MSEDRKWMYDGWRKNGRHSDEWFTKTKNFIEHAFSLTRIGKVKCPCKVHGNCVVLDKERVSLDLCQFGFMPGYEVWEHHGETVSVLDSDDGDNNNYQDSDAMHEMLDALRPELNLDSEDPPTSDVDRFFNLLKACEEPLHEHTEVSVLSFVTRLMAIKSNFFFSNNCYNELLKLIADVLSKPHKLPKDMYYSKVLVKALGMGYQKIDVCEDNCMLFWKEHEKEKKMFKV